MILLQNASRYSAHLLVANKVHFGCHVGGAEKSTRCAKSPRRPHDNIRGANCAGSPSGSVGPTRSCSDDDEGDDAVACDDSIRETSFNFTIWPASAEAFFSEIFANGPISWEEVPYIPRT